MLDRANVLLVDDKPANLTALSALLKGIDADLIEASSGNDALKLTLNYEFALILLDVQMPGMDGFETAELLRSSNKTKHIPIIFVTAISKDQKHLFRGYEAGAVDYLYKPIEPTILVSKVAVFLDLYQQKRELEQAKKELARSNEELDDFAYIVSHDLKEPLRGIHNYSQFLLEDYSDTLDEDGTSKLNTLVRLTGQMGSLIDSLLKFSRLGRVDLAVEETNLNEILQGVLDSLRIRLEDEDIDIRIPSPLPTVRCDSARIGEVFRNLITNAMKYNDKDQKWIEIGCSPGIEGVMSLVFYVRDNGIGIREKHLDTVFRVFKRLHGRDKFGGGTGAGLTIVKKIVERHGGKIWVESEFGKGTTFYFTINDGTENGNIDRNTAANPDHTSGRRQPSGSGSDTASLEESWVGESDCAV